MRRCGNCGDPLADRGRRVEKDGKVGRWCDDCADDETERLAALERERQLGVYNSEEESMGTPKYEAYEGKNGEWFWRQVGGNGEIVARSSEGYSTKQHAEEGIDAAIAEAEQVAAAEREQEGGKAE